MLSGKSDGVLGDHCFTGRRVGSDENGVAHLETVDSFLLEVVELEWVLDVSVVPQNTTYLSCHLGHQVAEL